MTVDLRVLCWDHPRCTGPMAAVASAYTAVRPDVTVHWGTRPLAMFNDQPVWEADDGYDLIFLDHPMTGAIAQRRALVPIDTVLPASVLQRIADESMGAGHASYRWAGHQWALGVDTTSQVAAHHQTRLGALGAQVPRTWDDVLALASSAPGSVALPLYPSDAMCSLISLSANAALAAGSPPDWLHRDGVEMLVELVRLVDASCFDLNPPRLLEQMRQDGRIAYVPYVFGYADLARPPLAFTDVPGLDGVPRGAVLGGAGLGVFPSSSAVDDAAAFAAWCMSTDVQRDVLVPAGGQPGNRLAWEAPGQDSATRHYLMATRASVEHAYVRPRDPWWPEFQREAGQQLVRMLRGGPEHSAAAIEAELRELAERHRSQTPSAAQVRS